MGGVSGLVVAGGRSARLGVDKRTVRLDGITLLDRAVGLLADLSDDVMVAARDAEGVPAGVRVVTDPLPDRGPMAGILAGLRHARRERLLVIPVDMPLLTTAFLRFLEEVDPAAAITVPSWQAGLEPVVAVYHTTCARPLAALIARGTTAVHAFINSTELRVHRVEEADIRRYGAPGRLFLNVNAQEDLIRAEAMLRAPRPRDGPR